MEERESVYQLQSQRLSTMREYLTNLFCKLQQARGSTALQTCMKQHICAVQGQTVVAFFPHISCKCKCARRKYEGLKVTKPRHGEQTYGQECGRSWRG